MKRIALALLLAAGSAAVTVASLRAAVPEAVGCRESHRDPFADLHPLASGPLRLAGLFCLSSPRTDGDPPRLSPDERRYVIAHHQGLAIGATAGGMPAREIEGRVSNFSVFNDPLTAWSADGRALYWARQEVALPSGFPLAPKRPVLLSFAGGERALPHLTHPAGPLDQIFWIGGPGLALAAFGTKGGYYRPEHDDPDPTIAFVDAAAGHVLQSASLKPLLGVREPLISSVSATSTPGGQMRAVLAVSGKWLHWVRGEAPRLLPLALRSDLPFALAPDGRTLVVARGLSASGVICEHNPDCPRPIPTSGPIAEAYAVPSGRLLWSLRGRAETFSGRGSTPAISPDGRYALISMPYRDMRLTIAVVSMRDGTILQEIPSPWSSGYAAGFAADGRTVWIGGGSRIVTYAVRN